MDLTLYHNNDLSNVVDKTLTKATTISGTAFVLPYDERFPTIRVTGVANYDDFNYFKIGDKYYYITKIEWKTNQESILHGELDLLVTFKSYIRDLNCYLKRSDNHTTPYINDEMQVLQCNQNYVRVNFPDDKALGDEDTDGVYILVTAQSGYGAVTS